MPRDIRTSIGVGVFATAFVALQLRLGLSLDDEGLLCDYAQRILQGQTPYVDFIPPYELGRYLLVALMFWLFGASVIVMRVLFIGLLGVTAALTHRIARRILPHGFDLLPSLLLTVLAGPLWKADIHFGLALIALTAIRYGEEPSTRRAAMAGGVAGLIAWDRPDLALIALACSAIARLASRTTRSRARDALIFAGAAVAVTLPLAAALLYWPGALTGFVDAHLWMLRLSDAFGLPLPLPWQSRIGLFNGILFYLGPGLAIVAWLVPPKDKITWAVLSVAGVLIWNQVRIRANFGHALQAAWPVWLLLPALLVRFTGRVAAPIACALFLWQGVLASTTYAGLFAVLEGRAVRTGWARADVLMPPRIAEQLDTLFTVVNAQTGPLLVLPYAPMVNFISGAKNPTFLDNFLPGRLDADAEQRVIADLAQTDRVLLMPFEEPRPMQSYLPQLVAYLDEHFESDPRIGGSAHMLVRKITNPSGEGVAR